MTSFPLTLLVGIATGFFGAIPPGPLNVTIIRKASADQSKAAFRVAFGGALVDILICGGIGLGFGWILEKVVTNPWVKGPLALFLIGYGAFIAIRDRTRAERMAQPGPEAPSKVPAHGGRFSFLIGFFQGAANPALFVNWTFVIGFLVGHRVIRATPGAAAAFALGVGLGVFAWFALLIELLCRLKNHPPGRLPPPVDLRGRASPHRVRSLLHGPHRGRAHLPVTSPVRGLGSARLRAGQTRRRVSKKTHLDNLGD